QTRVTVSSVDDATSLLDKLGILDHVLLKLVNRPEAAVHKLRIALSEVRRGYDALQDALLKIDLLSFEKQDIEDTREELQKIAAGKIKLTMAEAKGSCTRIGNIYDKYLQGWFSAALNPGEADELRLLFNDLRYTDAGLLKASMRLSIQAEAKATEILNHLKTAGGETRARRAAEEFSLQFRRTLEKLTKQLVFMLELENKLIQITGVP
ncbi:MAG: hypothetical protein GWO20_02530, partial [Candidatus Korarchaeota archaeon]|nr:hypothetical protein [Candidatus Korarchaeota archaeon]